LTTREKHDDTDSADSLEDRPDEVLTGDAAIRARSPFYALTFRNFRLFFFGQFISVIGTWMQTVAEQWVVYDLTKSGVWLGIVSGASALPYIVFAIWGGQIADRYPRRDTLIITQTASAILAVCLALLAGGFPVQLQAWHIAVLAGLLGIVKAFNMPAQQALVADIVEDKTALGNAIALNSLRFNLARFIGPVLAGVALVKFGAKSCFWLNALSFVAVIYSLMLMRPRPFVPRSAKDLQLSQGLQYIWRVPTVLRVHLLLSAASLFTWSISTVFPLLSALFNRGEAGYSTIMSIQGAGAAMGGLGMALFGNRLSQRLLVYGGLALQSVALLLMTASHLFPLVLVCLALNGVALITFAIAANTKVQEEVPDALRGRVMAVYSLIQNVLPPLGGLLLGFVAQNVGVYQAIVLFSGACLLCTLSLWVWNYTDRRSRIIES
jgi:MFS family permease